jgi:hypothetical protein
MATNSLTDSEIRRIIGQPTNAYDTHRPVLAEALIRTSGPILELGMGEGSTPGLHEVAESTYRYLLSFEDDKEWYRRFIRFQSPYFHNVALVGSWDDAPCEAPVLGFAERWGVALVDHGQVDRRVREIGRLANHCDVVVVHDTEDTRYRYWTIFGLFKHRLDYMRIKPWTTLFSNFIDVSKWTIP